MTTTLQLQDTKINAHYSFGMNIAVTLSDEEQFLVEIPVFENAWSSTNRNIIGTRKVRVERLSYEDKDGKIGLRSINYRGFCKDGSLRVKDEYEYKPNGSYYSQVEVWNALFQAIPTHYHNHAITEFNKLIVEALNEVTTLQKNGVVIQ